MEENEIFVEELIERLMEYYSRIRKESHDHPLWGWCN